MATIEIQPPCSEKDLSAELAKSWPTIENPGYWETLETNCSQWASDISVCPFWREANERLDGWKAEYRSQYGGALLAEAGPFPNFIGKGKERIRSKLRNLISKDKNFINSAFHSDPPVPSLNDLVRVRISCLFLDGVNFLANKLTDLAKDMNIYSIRSYEGSLEGYFAQHVNFKENVFYRLGGESKPVEITCEIQIATDLSTRIWEGQHPVYEIAREAAEKPEEWQWNPSDPRFVARQLGHMIHLADGLLVQLREAVKKK